MARIRYAVLTTLVACLLLVPAAPASATSPEVQMVRKVNSFRAKNGLPQVRMSKSLMNSSERYAWKQMRSGYFGHQNRIAASSKYRTLGEILEWHTGLRPSVSTAFRDWLHSSGHRAIIMDRRFRYAGAGAASGRFQGRNSTIWVMHFGAR
jgi:uncharacterized protein YkwD